MQVVCVNVGNKWGPEWVERLQRAVTLNLSIPHDFAVITDQPHLYNCRTLKAIPGLPGWWQKVSLFAGRRPYVSNRVMYFDLDTVIVDSIDTIAKLPGAFVGILDRWQAGGVINSSFMLWDHDLHTYVWDEFDPAVMKQMHGDQNYIDTKVRRHVMHANEMYPEWIKSWKADMNQQGAPIDEKIIYFHGQPTPDKIDWVKSLWNQQEWCINNRDV